MAFFCPNCGESIPVAGRVCPFCQFDKRAHARQYELSLWWAAGGVTTGILFGIILRSWLIGFGAAFLLGAIAGNVARVLLSPKG